MRGKLHIVPLLILLSFVFSLKEFVPTTICVHVKDGIAHFERDHPGTFEGKEKIHIKFLSLSEIKVFKISTEGKSYTVKRPLNIDLSPSIFRKPDLLQKRVESFDSPVRTVRLLI